MLEGGTNIRHDHEQFGHACLRTAQIYIHIMIPN
jgi:site-specific recombinase XerC